MKTLEKKIRKEIQQLASSPVYWDENLFIVYVRKLIKEEREKTLQEVMDALPEFGEEGRKLLHDGDKMFAVGWDRAKDEITEIINKLKHGTIKR